MTPTELIIQGVQGSLRAKRDADLERHHQANATLQAVFDALNDPSVHRHYGADADRGGNSVDIVVTRVNKRVCTITKNITNDPLVPDIRVIDQSVSTPLSKAIHGAEAVVEHVVYLLEDHKARFPTVDRLEGYRSRGEEDAPVGRHG